MKKYFFLASILAFMSCSSDSSSSSDNGEGTKPPVKENEVGRLLYIKETNNRSSTDLYLYNPKTNNREFVTSFKYDEYYDFQDLVYDEESEIVYLTTLNSSNSRLLSYSLRNKQLLSDVVLTPTDLVSQPQYSVLTQENNILSFNRAKGNLSLTHFMSIGTKDGSVKLEDGSKKLPDYYMDGFCDYFFLDRKKRNELVVLCYSHDGNGVGNQDRIVKLNVNDFSEFDINTEDKVITLKTEGLNLRGSSGFIQDKDGNYYCVFNVNNNGNFGSIVFLVNKSDGSLFKILETDDVYNMEYDELSNSLFLLVNRNGDHVNMFVQYNLAKNTIVKEVPLEVEDNIVAMKVIK